MVVVDEVVVDVDDDAALVSSITATTKARAATATATPAIPNPAKPAAALAAALPAAAPALAPALPPAADPLAEPLADDELLEELCAHAACALNSIIAQIIEIIFFISLTPGSNIN